MAADGFLDPDFSNTDDHLPNHGFLHERGDSWTLSSAFDLNPDRDSG
jgi:serine/threonine-protein kinase HipA